MALISVRNKEGTGDNDPPSTYSSWIEFWEKGKKMEAEDYGEFFCKNKAEVGGHVIKSGGGGKEYIIPICKSHNGFSSETDYVVWDTDLVPVT